MAIPELDLKKVNLQAAVGYLISLHDNEVDWNLLGIKVIGHIDALPIPAGNYEYGDAYMVGTEPPYDMYIYTRPDGAVHTEGYWFPIGKFPMPGPKGDKGDGIGQVQLFQEGLTTNLTYDSTNGGKSESISSMTYKDSTTGQRLTQNFQMVSRLPIIPGKYVSMNSTSDNKKMEVKVDDAALALDYYKITKGNTANVPAYSPNNGVITLPYSYQTVDNSLVRRGMSGEIKFTYGIFGSWNDINSGNILNFDSIYRQCGDGRGSIVIDKTSTDKGTITMKRLTIFQNNPQVMIEYNNQTYYRMDPMSAPDGTLNYIHLDSIEDGNGRYKATGKCFSINVSTREWKVFDLDFGGSTSTTDIYRHGITMNDSDIVVKLDIYDNNSQNYTYEQLKAKLALNPAHCANARIKRSDNTYYYSPATIKYWNDSTGDFVLTYNNTEGNSVNVNWTPSVVADNGTQIL